MRQIVTKKSVFSNWKFTISSPEEMEQLWWRVAKAWYKKILLYGELGAGKTHFVKWFVKKLWWDPQLVQSPTYTYVHVYALQKGRKEQKVWHFDFYRIEKKEDLINKWLHVLIEECDFVLIERPKFTSLYVDTTWLPIYIEKGAANDRKVCVKDVAEMPENCQQANEQIS